MDSSIRELARLWGLARTQKEREVLLRDWLTPSEARDLHERWLIADGLLSGKSQRQIKEEVGVSISLVTRASNLLKAGGDGFRMLFHRTHKKS